MYRTRGNRRHKPRINYVDLDTGKLYTGYSPSVKGSSASSSSTSKSLSTVSRQPSFSSSSSSSLASNTLGPSKYRIYQDDEGYTYGYRSQRTRPVIDDTTDPTKLSVKTTTAATTYRRSKGTKEDKGRFGTIPSTIPTIPTGTHGTTVNKSNPSSTTVSTVSSSSPTVWDQYLKRLHQLFNRIRFHQTLLDSYENSHHSRSSSLLLPFSSSSSASSSSNIGSKHEKLQPIGELLKAKRIIAQTKVTIRELVTEVWNYHASKVVPLPSTSTTTTATTTHTSSSSSSSSSSTPIPRSAAKRSTLSSASTPRQNDTPRSGSILAEDIVCSECGSGEVTDTNDILLCDYIDCHRSYHQYCCVPPIDNDHMPLPDEDWVCARCACTVCCIMDINDEFGTDYDRYTDIFPDANDEYTSAKMNEENYLNERYHQHRNPTKDGKGSKKRHREDEDAEEEEEAEHDEEQELTHTEDTNSSYRLPVRQARLAAYRTTEWQTLRNTASSSSSNGNGTMATTGTTPQSKRFPHNLASTSTVVSSFRKGKGDTSITPSRTATFPTANIGGNEDDEDDDEEYSDSDSEDDDDDEDGDDEDENLSADEYPDNEHIPSSSRKGTHSSNGGFTLSLLSSRSPTIHNNNENDNDNDDNNYLSTSRPSIRISIPSLSRTNSNSSSKNPTPSNATMSGIVSPRRLRKRGQVDYVALAAQLFGDAPEEDDDEEEIGNTEGLSSRSSKGTSLSTVYGASSDSLTSSNSQQPPPSSSSTKNLKSKKSSSSSGSILAQYHSILSGATSPGFGSHRRKSKSKSKSKSNGK